MPHTIACLGFPRSLGLAIDWTFFDTTLPSGRRMRYQVLRIAVPRKGRALPLLQLAYDRDNLSPNKSQNRIEQDALLALVGALPMGVRPVVLADRGFHRASFIACCWLARHHLLHYVVRIRKGACITEASEAIAGSWARRGSSSENCASWKRYATVSTTTAPGSC